MKSTGAQCGPVARCYGVGGGVLVVVTVRSMVPSCLVTVISFSNVPPFGPVLVTSRVKPSAVLVLVELSVEVLPLKPVLSFVVVRPLAVFSLLTVLLAVLPSARVVWEEPVTFPVVGSVVRLDSRVLTLPFGLVYWEVFSTWPGDRVTLVSRVPLRFPENRPECWRANALAGANKPKIEIAKAVAAMVGKRERVVMGGMSIGSPF